MIWFIKIWFKQISWSIKLNLGFLRDWHGSYRLHELGLGSNSSPSPMMSMGKPKAIKAFTNLGFSFGPKPLNPKSMFILFLGLSATWPSSSPQEDHDGENGGEKGIAGGLGGWSKLQPLRAISSCRAASSAIEHIQLQLLGAGVEPAAAASMRAWRDSSADITLDAAAKELL